MKLIDKIKMRELFKRIARPECDRCDGRGYVPGEGAFGNVNVPCPDCRAAEQERIKERFEDMTYEQIGRSANRYARRKARKERLRRIFRFKFLKG